MRNLLIFEVSAEELCHGISYEGLSREKNKSYIYCHGCIGSIESPVGGVQCWDDEAAAFKVRYDIKP